MTIVHGDEEEGKCYDNATKVNGKLVLGNCVFAWRLYDRIIEDDGNPSYRFDSTAGADLGDIEFSQDGKLQAAIGPSHNGNKDKPEWDAEFNHLEGDSNIWKIKAYGIASSHEDAVCYARIVKDGAGSNFKDGCWRYNYHQSTRHREGYVDKVGASNGGPIMKIIVTPPEVPSETKE